MSAVVLVDSGGANIGSVRAALARLGVDAPLVRDAAAIRAAARVILPGVGAAPPAMARLRELDLIDTLRGLEQPLLGVCLGMQLLFERSEEGGVDCLGRLPGAAVKMSGGPGLRIPHMGWNAITPVVATPLLAGLPDDPHAYFVHSYALPVGATTLATSTHGVPFSAVVGRDNVYGAQFHPERSAAVGAALLKNFLEL